MKSAEVSDELVVIETHPIQYHAPIYRTLETQFNIPVTAIYGSDFSIAGYQDREFGAAFAWDTDLLSSYTSIFLSRVSNGGAGSAESVTAHGLGKILQRLAPRAVLLTGYSPRFYQRAIWYAWRSPYPILFRGETTDSAKTRTTIKHLTRSLFLKGLYGRCSGLLFVGKSSHQHYQRLGCPESKLFFSPYCVDTSSFRTSDAARDQLRKVTRQSLGITDSQIAVLFSGKLVNRKAPDLLLQAIKSLPDEIRNRVVLVFLGSGELLESLKVSAQTTPFVTAKFVGFQNQSALSRYYHAADLLVLPSLHSETWGLVVNEALHHGVPCVVSSRVGCASDLIEPGVTGEVFSAGRVDELVDALKRAMELIGQPDVRAKCRDRVNNYTVEKAAAGIAEVFAAVIQKKKPA